RPDVFDLILSIFTSFGYFEDEKDDLRVLENIRRSLKPRGTLVIDLLSKERLAKVFQPTLSQRTEDGALLVKRLEIVDDWTRARNEYVVIRDGRARTFEFTLRMYSGQELKQLLR